MYCHTPGVCNCEPQSGDNLDLGGARVKGGSRHVPCQGEKCLYQNDSCMSVSCPTLLDCRQSGMEGRAPRVAQVGGAEVAREHALNSAEASERRCVDVPRQVGLLIAT